MDARVKPGHDAECVARRGEEGQNPFMWRMEGLTR